MAEFDVAISVTQIYDIPVTAETVDDALNAAAGIDLSTLTPIENKTISVTEK